MGMITKPIKIVFTAGQAAVLKVMIEELITRPTTRETDNTMLARYVVADWYKRNAGRFVFVSEQLRLTFTPSQALALNTLLLKYDFDCTASHVLARNIVGLIEPKI
jgi:hypothetical protein